jgi:hypothetical protein
MLPRRFRYIGVSAPPIVLPEPLRSNLSHGPLQAEGSLTGWPTELRYMAVSMPPTVLPLWLKSPSHRFP